MISPYVRRLRFGIELLKLRMATKLTSEQLAKRAGINRQMVSKLENGRIPPDQNDVLQLLDALGVSGDRWTDLLQIATEAGHRGWWEGISRSIGERQALFADLESGAATIREYPQAILPGLLQTPEYTRARTENSNSRPLPQGVTTDGVLMGRLQRQRMLHRPGGGPAYEAIIDEFGIRRMSVPPEVLRDQLIHTAEMAAREDGISIRVLPVDAQIEGYNVAVCPFSIYTYSNGDPDVVGIEAVTTDAVLVEPEETSAYSKIFDGLRKAALSTQDSHRYLIKAAEALPAQ